MVKLNSVYHRRLVEALKEAEETRNPHSWVALLDGTKSRVYDPFLAVIDYGFDRPMFSEPTGYTAFGEWLQNVDGWCHQVESDPDFVDDTGSLVLYKA